MTDTTDSLSLRFLVTWPTEAAGVLARLEPAEVAAFLATVPPRIGAGPLAGMAPWQAGRCLAAMDPAEAGALLEALPAAQRARCLRVARDCAREAILQHVSRRRARAVRRQLRYPAALVGAWMSGDAVSLPGETTVEEALAAVRAQGSQGTVQVYIVDADGRPVGVVPVAALVQAPAQQAVARLMRRELASVSADAPIERLEVDPAWEERPERPVVDARGRLLGTLSLTQLIGLHGHAGGGGPTAGPTPSAALLGGYGATIAGLIRTAVGLVAAPGRTRDR